MKSKTEVAKGSPVTMVVRQNENHADAGFFLLKKDEKLPLHGMVVKKFKMPPGMKQIAPSQHQVGWIDFYVNGNVATTTSITPRKEKATALGLSDADLAIMRLVFLEKSINVLASKMGITSVGASTHPSEYTESQIHGLGLEIGVSYPVKQFLQALADGIKKSLDVLGKA